MKTYYTDLTRKQTIEWLATKDTSADIGSVSWWRQEAPSHTTKQLQEEIRYNIAVFGADDEVTIRKPRFSMKLAAYQKQENKLRRSFERHFRIYSYDFTWDKELGYTHATTAAVFLGFQIGYSKGARK